MGIGALVCGGHRGLIVGIGALVCGGHRGSIVGIGALVCGGHRVSIVGIHGLCLVHGYHRNTMNGERRVTYVGFNN